MSDEATKVKRSTRKHDTWTVIAKRKKLVKSYGIGKDYSNCGHKLSKMNGINCGDPRCIMCANPRKMFKERTLKEKAFDEEINWVEYE